MAARHLDELFRRIVDDLQGLETSFALVGGLAISLRATPRATADIDFAVAVESDRDAEVLTRAIHARGYVPLQVLENQVTGHLATVRFGTRRSGDEQPRVDVLFDASGIEREVVRGATRMTLHGRNVPVASLPHLIALKVLSQGDTRPQDRADLLGLLAVATKSDLQIACAALDRIAARGCARGKDLQAELATLLSR